MNSGQQTSAILLPLLLWWWDYRWVSPCPATGNWIQFCALTSTTLSKPYLKKTKTEKKRREGRKEGKEGRKEWVRHRKSKSDMVADPCNASLLRRQRYNDYCRFKAHLGSRMSSRLGWASVWEPISEHHHQYHFLTHLTTMSKVWNRSPSLSSMQQLSCTTGTRCVQTCSLCFLCFRCLILWKTSLTTTSISPSY